MASELRVNTLKDASGNNSIGMSYVAEGSAKVWVTFDGTALVPLFTTVLMSVSLTDDDGTGNFDTNVNFSSNCLLQITRQWLIVQLLVAEKLQGR